MGILITAYIIGGVLFSSLIHGPGQPEILNKSEVLLMISWTFMIIVWLPYLLVNLIVGSLVRYKIDMWFRRDDSL